jgi:hypothetical protein
MPPQFRLSSPISPMLSAELPLTALFSKILVAFIIEFDNELERLLPHWTTASRKARSSITGTWLVSMAGWYFMQLIGEGATVGELRQLARAPVLPLNGMERWGYVKAGPNPLDQRAKPLKREWLRPTAKGSAARDLGLPLCGAIEERWRQRFGSKVIDALCTRLADVTAALDPRLPDFLPVLGDGLFTEIYREKASAKSSPRQDRVDSNFADSLPSMLSKVLVSIALDFEKDWPISLSVAANVLRVLTEQGLAIRDLPQLSGVSKEAIAFATGWLLKRKLIEYTMNPAEPRKKLLRLAERGIVAQLACNQRLGAVEKDFESRFRRG